MTAMALFNTFWYVMFHVHSIFTDISPSSGSHTSAVTGKILLRYTVFLGMFVILFDFGGGMFVNAVNFLGSGLTLHLEIISPKYGIL